MNDSRYQFSIKELLLLPIFAIAAINVNAALNYLLFDVESAFVRFWLDYIASTMGPLAYRSIDTAVAFLIAIVLVKIGRLTQLAALTLLLTLPFSPQIGRGSPCFHIQCYIELLPEFVMALVGVIVVLHIAANTKRCSKPHTQLFALVVFFIVATLGWWKMNPRGYGGPPIQMESDADNKAVQQSTRSSVYDMVAVFPRAR